MRQNAWWIVHNLVAHPLLLTGARWAERFHDWTAARTETEGEKMGTDTQHTTVTANADTGKPCPSITCCLPANHRGSCGPYAQHDDGRGNVTTAAADVISANRDALAAEWAKVTLAYPPPVHKEGEPEDPREEMSLGEWVVHELQTRDRDYERMRLAAGSMIGTLASGWQKSLESKDGQIERLNNELLRLNGPRCSHDQKRASEHLICPYETFGCTKDRIHVGCKGSAGHPDWPEGEEWLRSRA